MFLNISKDLNNSFKILSISSLSPVLKTCIISNKVKNGSETKSINNPLIDAFINGIIDSIRNQMIFSLIDGL
jgi:hypothetical protein